MTIENLENKLQNRLLKGQNQEHDEELFLEVIALLFYHPDLFQKMLPLYMASLSRKGCKDAGKTFNDFLDGKIKVEGEGYGL